MSQLENLEAKMANIEVSLSSSNLGRKRKSISLNATISSRNSTRLLPREIESILQNEDSVHHIGVDFGLQTIQKLCLELPQDFNSVQTEQYLKEIQRNADNKRIAIQNLRSGLQKLDISDNIDVRIRQAELEYALGREELKLLSLMEKERQLQQQLDRSKSCSNTLFNNIQSGINLSLHAVQATIGRWSANPMPNLPGIYIEWALDGEDLIRGDRILEVNGKIVSYETRDDLMHAIGSTGTCLLVVIRKQKLNPQENNFMLQRRISFLEKQVVELRKGNETHNTRITSGISGHVTSINISLPQSSQGSHINSKDNVNKLVDGNFVKLNKVGSLPHFNKRLVKENGCYSDTESIYNRPIKPFGGSKISINSDIAPLSKTNARMGNSASLHRPKYIGDSHHTDLYPTNQQSYTRSVEHLHYNALEKRKLIEKGEHFRKCGVESVLVVKKTDLEAGVHNRKQLLDLSLAPVNLSLASPAPPKKPLRLSLHRAQSLQTVEIKQISEIDHKKSLLKRAHISAKLPEHSKSETNLTIKTAPFGRHKHI